MENLIKGINEVRSKAIGLFKMRNQNGFELVLNYDEEDESVDTVYVTSLLGVHQTYGVRTVRGQLELFPEGKSMKDMMENPFEWREFIRKFETQ